MSVSLHTFIVFGKCSWWMWRITCSSFISFCFLFLDLFILFVLLDLYLNDSDKELTMRRVVDGRIAVSFS